MRINNTNFAVPAFQGTLSPDHFAKQWFCGVLCLQAPFKVIGVHQSISTYHSDPFVVWALNSGSHLCLFCCIGGAASSRYANNIHVEGCLTAAFYCSMRNSEEVQQDELTR